MKKRCSRKAQVSVEYMMIIAISLMILLPGIYFFRNYVFESNDNILKGRVTSISSQLLTRAQKMYYYGPPSKTTIQVDMPPQVNAMYILYIDDIDPNLREYNLVFELLTTKGEEELFFESVVPMTLGATFDCNDINEYCIQGSCRCFPDRYFSKGLKNFKVEAVDGCENGENYCIKISESSAEDV